MDSQSLHGYLQKKGEKGLVKSFKKRWFEQNGSKIFYFRSKGEKTALGFIDVNQISTVRRTDLDSQASLQSSGRLKRDASVSFEIRTPKRVYDFIAATDEDATYWIEGISRLCKQEEELNKSQQQKEALCSLTQQLDDAKKRHLVMEVKLTEESSMLKKDLTTSQQKVQTQDSLIAKQRKELAKKDVKLIEYQIAMKELENTHRSEIEQRDKEIESLKKLVADLQAGKEEGSEQSSSEHGVIENFELRRQLEEKQREIMELKTSFQQLEKEREGEFNSKVREMAEEMEKRKMDISKMRAEIEERNAIIRIMQDSFERQQKERQRDVHKRESEMEGLILSFTNAKHQFESSLKKKDEIISNLKNQLGHKDEESPLLEAKDAQVPSKGTPEDGGGEEKVNKLMEQKEALQFLTNKLQNEVVELKVKAKKGEKEIKSLKEKLSKLSVIQHNNNNNESQGQQHHNFNGSNNNNNNVTPESGGDTEELEQQLFFALAVGIKLNLSMQGKQCTMTTPELYEKAKGANVPRKAWNKWILNTLQGQAAAANNPSFSS